MFKKSLLLMLLMAMFSPWVANAQETFTVYESETGTSRNTPIYNYYFDAYTRAQTVFPAADLAAMEDGTISAIKFYTSYTTTDYETDVDVDVYLAEVDASTISSFYALADATIVYTGKLNYVRNTENGNKAEITITFTTPFVYNGGNLLFGCDNQAKGDYENIYYYGKTQTGASIYGNNSSAAPTTASTANFLPKTTFTYTPNPYKKPVNLDYANINPTSTEVTWEEPITSEPIAGYLYSFKKTSDTDWPTTDEFTTDDHIVLDALEAGTSYDFRVKTDYTSEQSGYATISFTTLEACMTPENLVISNITAHTADLEWTEGYGNGQWVLKYKLSTESDYTNSVNVALGDLPYQLTGLDAETTYDVQIAPECDNTKTIEDSFTTTVACFAPTNLDVTAAGLDATFTWQSDVHDYQIAYATSATADPDSNIIGNAIDETYSFPGLTIDTDYYFWVRSYCGSEGYSSWAGPASVHIGYCAPNITSHDSKGITGVAFGTGVDIVNHSDANGIPSAAPFYGDYSSMIGAVQAGVESTIAITTNTGNYPYTFVIWVDLDNSLSFEDSEVLYVGKASSGTGTLNATITIPPTQALGDYRMRIFGADSYFTDFYNSGNPDYTKPHNPCADGTWRHACDFTVRVLEAPSCLTPTGLALNASGQTLQASWDGTATSYNIDINGTVYNNVTSPYVFNVELSTTYTVKVQANCPGDQTSEWSNEASFTTPDCWGGHVLNYSLTDSYSDGWNGASITFISGCDQSSLTLSSGASATGTLTICDDYFAFIWNSGNYDSECGFTFTEGGTTLFTKPSSLSDGTVLYTFGTQTPIPTGLTAGTPDKTSVELSWTAGGSETAWQLCVNGDEANLIDVNNNPFILDNLTQDTDYSVKIRAYIDVTTQSCWSDEETFHTAVACAKPENLTATDITTTSAKLSWDGSNDSYVLQYRPWLPAGDDVTATGTMKSATYSLAGFTGSGSVVIRHYNCNNQFALIVDDIVVTNAANEVVFSEDFETCGGTMPSVFTNMDMDGDGFEWEIAAASSSTGNMNVNGSYGIASYSYDNNTNSILYPNNWLIINNIPMGGEITFNYRGQDPSWAAEVFCVYVSTEASIVEVPVADKNYEVTGLTPNTPYAWQVKGLCGSEESRFASSFFQTLNDVIYFQTAGDWTDAANWDVNRVPTADDKVQIDAEATINSGEIAYAKTTEMGTTGSITIKDGGQLKQGTGTIDVTVEKVITGHTDDVSDGGWYLIATPLSTTLFASTTPGWPHADNLTNGNFDLYSFDATQEGNEWYNYQAHTSDFTKLNPTQGYLYANKEGLTTEPMKFVGTTYGKSLNNTVEVDFVYDATSTTPFNGFVLLGNPFTCNAYLSFTPETGYTPSSDVNFYVMNADGTDFELANRPLKVAEGAFFYGEGNGTIKIGTEAPTKSTGMLNMTLTKDNANVSQARVRFGEGQSLKHLSFRENSSKLYIPQNEKEYAVVYADNQGEMPLCFKAETNGNYTISFNSTDVEFGYLHLIDNMTGADVDLLATPSYSFDAKYTDYASRFKLVFATSNTDDSFAFIGNGEIILSGVNSNSTVQLFDVTGRKISSTNGANSIAIDNMAAGVYMIRLINGDNVKTQKIIVK